MAEIETALARECSLISRLAGLDGQENDIVFKRSLAEISESECPGSIIIFGGDVQVKDLFLISTYWINSILDYYITIICLIELGKRDESSQLLSPI